MESVSPQIWQIVLAVVMIGMFSGSIWLAIQIFSRRYKETKSITDDYLKTYLGTMLGDHTLKVTRDSLYPAVKGKIDGKEVDMQFVIKPHGLKSVHIEGFEDISLFILKVKMSSKDKTLAEQNKRTVEGITSKYGGKVRTSGKWLTWMRMKSDPGKDLQEVLKKIAKEVR